MTYLASTSWSITDRLREIGPTRCWSRRCKGRELVAGERITAVHHLRRLAANPNAADALAYLCESCVARLDVEAR